MIYRGDIYYADLEPVIGSEQGGLRPVVIIQNDKGNLHSPTVIIAAITSSLNKAGLPTHVILPETKGLYKESMVMLEQIRTVDKLRLKNKIGSIDQDSMESINKALKVSLELNII